VYGTGTSGTYSGSASSHHIAHYGFDDTYVIDSEKYVYVVMRMRKNRHSRMAHLIVNAPLRFAAEKGSLFVVDEDGREFKMRIVKETMKAADGQQNH
jgi:hypothetical protein